MGMDKTMIAAGVGCTRGTSAREIEAAIRAALARANIATDALDVIATIEAKSAEAGIQAAAEKFGLAMIVVSETELKAASDRTATRSERSLALAGVPSAAEAAALAAAGPASSLIAVRLVVGTATCALAASVLPPEVSPTDLAGGLP
jgi:cobalt-precorrin 5A hydrolase